MSQDFKFLGKEDKITDIPQEKPKPESVAMTQAEFEKNSSNKKELDEFLRTQNVFLPKYDCMNTDYLSGIMSDDRKYFFHADIKARTVEFNEYLTIPLWDKYVRDNKDLWDYFPLVSKQSECEGHLQIGVPRVCNEEF